MRIRDWLSIIGLVVGIAGLSVAWMSVTRCKDPRYTSSGMNLVSSSISDYGKLQVQFEDQTVPRVTVTYLCLWNAGSETIRWADVAPGDPVRLMSRAGTRILSCTVTKASRRVVRAGMDQSDWSRQIVRFDFLDHNDFVLLQVIHTGANAEDCSLGGTVMGCPTRLSYVALPDEGSWLCPGRLLASTVSAELLVGTVILFVLRRKAARGKPVIPRSHVFAWLLVIVVLSTVTVVSLSSARYVLTRVPMAAIPR